jgi:hypothetical protein
MENEPIELTLQDLSVVRAIIDAATQKGVFTASDLTTVGTVHDKINRILIKFTEEAKKAQEAAAKTSEEEPDTPPSS